MFLAKKSSYDFWAAALSAVVLFLFAVNVAILSVEFFFFSLLSSICLFVSSIDFSATPIAVFSVSWDLTLTSKLAFASTSLVCFEDKTASAESITICWAAWSEALAPCSFSFSSFCCCSFRFAWASETSFFAVAIASCNAGAASLSFFKASLPLTTLASKAVFDAAKVCWVLVKPSTKLCSSAILATIAFNLSVVTSKTASLSLLPVINSWYNFYLINAIV